MDYKPTIFNGSQFLEPLSDQFPFDGTVRELVTELKKKDFRSPGIGVQFNRDPRPRKDALLFVTEIYGEDFSVNMYLRDFSMSNEKPESFFAVPQNIGATGIAIPRKRLYIPPKGADEKRLMLSVYSGADWERDKEGWFYDFPKIKKDPNNVRYAGSDMGNAGQVVYDGFLGKSKPYLVVLEEDRTALPDGAQSFYETKGIFKEFDSHLKSVVESIRKIE